MANDSQQPLGFSEFDFSWTQYTATRPKYPVSFFNLLYQYHDTHASPSDKWGTAMDVGAGHGVIVEHLAERFKNVAVCEPNEEYLRFAED